VEEGKLFSKQQEVLHLAFTGRSEMCCTNTIIIYIL